MSRDWSRDSHEDEIFTGNKGKLFSKTSGKYLYFVQY